MLKKILIGLAAAVALFAGVVAMQPDQYRVERSATIQTDSATVFNLINNFHKWDDWSPWAKLDPNMKTTYSGPDAGQGANYHWTGNDEVGEGNMLITESRPNEHVGIKLDFIKPFESTNKTEFELKGSGNQTTVQWIMTGNHNFMSKAMGLVMGGMDKMIGPDFERGLASMKTVAEKK